MRWWAKLKGKPMADAPTTVTLNLLDVLSPHCDSGVLHAPGACEYCDHYPQRQQGRVAALICFTGEDPREKGFGWVNCPSDAARGRGGAHVWGGNVPKPPGT